MSRREMLPPSVERYPVVVVIYVACARRADFDIVDRVDLPIRCALWIAVAFTRDATASRSVAGLTAQLAQCSRPTLMDFP